MGIIEGRQSAVRGDVGNMPEKANLGTCLAVGTHCRPPESPHRPSRPLRTEHAVVHDGKSPLRHCEIPPLAPRAMFKKWNQLVSQNGQAPPAAALDDAPQPFGQAHSPPLAPITSADGKHFGLENVRPDALPVVVVVMLTTAALVSLETHGESEISGYCPTLRSSTACSYANSVLQALYFCAPFRELVIQATDPTVTDDVLPNLPPLNTSLPVSPAAMPQPRPKDKFRTTPSEPPQSPAPAEFVPGSILIPHTPPTLFSALRSLFVHIARHPADRGTVAPRAFIDKLRALNEFFRSSMHQDAHEFLNFTLNQIVEDIKDTRRDAGPSSAEDCECPFRAKPTHAHAGSVQ